MDDDTIELIGTILEGLLILLWIGLPIYWILFAPQNSYAEEDIRGCSQTGYYAANGPDC